MLNKLLLNEHGTVCIIIDKDLNGTVRRWSYESRTVCNGVRRGTGPGIARGCPAEKDNAGCFFTDAENPGFRPAETINEKKEFCDYEFAWAFSAGDAHGVSIGKTLPAFEEEQKTHYEKQAFTPENAAAIPCRQVLGSYIVKFERTEKE